MGTEGDSYVGSHSFRVDVGVLGTVDSEHRVGGGEERGRLVLLLDAECKGHALPHHDLGKADLVLDRQSLVHKVDAGCQVVCDYTSTHSPVPAVGSALLPPGDPTEGTRAHPGTRPPSS